MSVESRATKRVRRLVDNHKRALAVEAHKKSLDRLVEELLDNHPRIIAGVLERIDPQEAAYVQASLEATLSARAS